MKQSLIFASMAGIISSALTICGLVALIYYGFSTNFFDEFLPQEKVVVQADKPTVYVPLSKVVMTVRGASQDHLVLIEISLETRTPKALGDVETFMPLVKNRLLRLFSDKTHADLVGYNSLANVESEIESTLIQTLEQRGITGAIENVIVTKFIVQ